MRDVLENKVYSRVGHASSAWPTVCRTATVTRDKRGYTLIEMMFVVCLIGILGSMAVLQVDSMRPALQGDGAMRVVMAELNFARETAITQRRKVIITFAGTNVIRVTRQEEPVTNGTTVLREVTFEAGVEYALISGVADTPDAFGNSTATSFGSATSIKFNTEGALVDNADNPVNGTIFLARPGVARSFRAVTVQGSTGRVRGFKWSGNQWTRA